ncbi:Protein of unknown function, partial [Gryllus bimaculatus]
MCNSEEKDNYPAHYHAQCSENATLGDFSKLRGYLIFSSKQNALTLPKIIGIKFQGFSQHCFVQFKNHTPGIGHSHSSLLANERILSCVYLWLGQGLTVPPQALQVEYGPTKKKMCLRLVEPESILG